MTVESDFYTLLSGNAGVIAVVGARIYPDSLPEKCAYPAVVFSRTRTETLRTLAGVSVGADVDLTVQCWAETRTAADAAALAVAAALSGTDFETPGPEAAADPETGLLASLLVVSTFAAA